MSFEVDTRQLTAYMNKLKAKIGNMAEFIADFAESDLVPILEGLASSERNVITDTYASTWEVTPRSDTEVIVTTDAEYWVYLERGTKYIKGIPVVGKAAYAARQDLSTAIVRYLEST